MNGIILIVIPLICYAGQALYYFRSDPPMSLVFASYAVGNVGWVWFELARTVP